MPSASSDGWLEREDSTADRIRIRALRLDHERRQVRQALISALRNLVAEAQNLTAATLRFDPTSLAIATAALKSMSCDASLDLARTAEVYGALRVAVGEGQPGRFVEAAPPDPPDATVTTAGPSSLAPWARVPHPLTAQELSPDLANIRWPHLAP